MLLTRVMKNVHPFYLDFNDPYANNEADNKAVVCGLSMWFSVVHSVFKDSLLSLKLRNLASEIGFLNPKASHIKMNTVNKAHYLLPVF